MDSRQSTDRRGNIMKATSRHYFASALTGQGFYSFWPQLLADLQHIYLLKGSGPGGKSLFLRLLGLALTDRGYNLAYYHLPEDYLALEGLVVPDLGVGLVDGESSGLQRDALPQSVQVTDIDLNEGTESATAGDHDTEAARKQVRQEAATLLQEAGHIWVRICELSHTPSIPQDLERQATQWVQERLPGPSHLQHYFAGAISDEGPVDFIAHLTTASQERYFIKGAPGSGRAVMQEILIQALGRHYDVEAYHSYLHPLDLVMLILPEAGLSVVDGTGSEGLDPLRGDLIWDLTGRQGPMTRRGATQIEQSELQALLTATGRTLHRARPEERTTGVPSSEEDIADYISRLLKENADFRQPAG